MTDARSLRARGALLSALAVLVCGALAGCPPQPQPQPPAPTPTPPPPPPPPAAEVPPQALLHLADLKPAIEKPVNPAGAADVSDRAKGPVAEAEKLLAAKDYAGAIPYLERAIGYDAKNPKVLRLLGLAYFGMGDRSRAEQNLQKAVEQVGDDLEAQAILGSLHEYAQKVPEATLAYRKALLCTGFEPNDPLAAEAMLNLGTLLEQQKYWTAASECYAKLTAWLDQPSPRYAQRPALQQLMLRPERLMVRRGTVLLLLHRPREAQEFLQAAHGLNRTDTATSSMLVRCLLDLGDFSGVEALLVRLSTDLDEPDLSRFVPSAAEEAARSAHDTALPGRVWRAIPRKTKADPMLAVGLAQASRRLGANDAAIEILQSVFQSMPQNVGMARELAELSAEVGRPQQGLAILVKTLSADDSAAPAVDQGLRQLARSLPDGFEEQQAQKPPADPNETFAYHYAVARLAQLRFKPALASVEYQKSIDAKKDFRPSREALIDALLDQRRYDEARDQLAGIEKLVEPWFVDYLRGKVELAQGKLPEAAKDLDQSLGANPQHAPTLLLLAEVELRKGQVAEALRRLDTALRLPGDTMEVIRRRFPLLMELGRFRQAETELETIRRGNPDNLEVGVMEALLFFSTNQKDKASALVAELATNFPDNSEVKVLSLQVELGAVNRILSKSDLERCRKKLDEILRRDPRGTVARRFLVQVLVRSARYGEAATAAKKLFDDESSDLEIAHLADQVALTARQYPLAKEILETTLRLAPGDGQSQQTILVVLERLKEYGRATELAQKWFSQATDGDQKTLFRLHLLRIYDEAKAYDKALSLLEEWAKTSNAGMLAMVKESQIRLLARLDKVEPALKIVSELAGGSEGVSKPRLVLIAGLNQAKKYDQSIKLLDEWIGKRKDANLEYLTARIQTYTEANRLDKARAAALEWIAADPLAYEPRGLLLIGLQKAERYDEGLKLLGEWQAKLSAATKPATAPAAATADQEKAQWILDRLQGLAGNFLFLSGKYEDALKYVEGELAKDANDADLYDLKSSCLTRLGKKKEALEALEAAWKLEPYDSARLNNLGYVYADKGVELERAEQMIRQSLAAAESRNLEASRMGMRQRPTLHILDSLGWALYKRGSLREAAFLFEDNLRKEEDKRALAHEEAEEEEDSSPISCVIYDHAGDVFWRLGWEDHAVEYWKQAGEASAKEMRNDPDAREVAAKAPLKIKAAQSGKAPAIAPLGEGVKEETK